MSSPVLSFPAADRQQWQDLVTKALKGATPDSLHRTDEDGLDIAALYQVEPVTEPAPDQMQVLSPAPLDIAALYQVEPVTEPASGQVPIYRLTANPAQRLAAGWRVCQPVDGNGKADKGIGFHTRRFANALGST